jgi:hypothetical protein
VDPDPAFDIGCRPGSGIPKRCKFGAATLRNNASEIRKIREESHLGLSIILAVLFPFSTIPMIQA